MSGRPVLVALAVALLLPGPSAHASHEPVVDPNDVPGRLDVRSVEVEGIKPVDFAIRTFEGWRISRIYDVGYFLIYFDTFGDRRFDYYMLVRSKKSRMESSLWRDREERRDVLIDYSRVRHPALTVLTVRAPLGKMRFGDARVQYRWQVRTLYISGRCYQKLCIDRAPDGPGVIEPIVPPK